MSTRINRRRFLKAGAAAVGAGYFHTATARSADRAGRGPNGRIAVAGVGVGGKGSGDIDQAGGLGEVVALCDIDDHRLGEKAKKYTSAKTFHDYRKMLDAMHKDIDAVTVSTPDHTHAPAALMAMRHKLHVYVQKPLCHTVFEARKLREVAKEMGVATQMGNQGTALNGLRRAVEIVQAGVIGPVREAHVWTNRPVWPQAPEIMARPSPMQLPPHIHWDDFLGPAPVRDYSSYTATVEDRKTKEKRTEVRGWYHPFNWRGWWDFGTGALGDMACHTANMAFMALKLGHPTSVVADATDLNPETYPSSAKVVFQFPARGEMPPVAFHWYEGKRDGQKVLPPADLLQKVLKKGEKLASSGSLLVGDKGILFSPDDYGAEFRLTPEEEFRAVQKKVPERLPKGAEVDKLNDPFMKVEWFEAIKGGPAAMSNFDYAALLTETILLGNIAIRLNGTLLEWDGPGLRFTNNPRATQFVTKEYRKGWSI